VRSRFTRVRRPFGFIHVPGRKLGGPIYVDSKRHQRQLPDPSRQWQSSSCGARSQWWADVFINFGSPILGTDGTFAYFGLTLNLTSAVGAGEYFAHFTNGTANPTSFTGRLGVRTSGTGFQLGYSESTNAGFTFGTTDLSFNTDYRVVVRYGFVNGALNDTGAVFVTPLATPFNPVESSNTPYLTDAYNGTTAEITQFTGFQFRQATSTAGAAGSYDDLVVASDFSSAAVPEPSAVVVLTCGIGLLGLIRRRR
jgi:hypothetical protein